MDQGSFLEALRVVSLLAVIGIAVKGIEKIEGDRLSNFRSISQRKIDYDFFEKAIPGQEEREKYLADLEERKEKAHRKYLNGYSFMRGIAWYSFLGIFTLSMLSLILN